MSGIKPEQLDYNAMVGKLDQQGFDWQSLLESTQDPGFGSLDRVHQKHIIDLLTVKSAAMAGEQVDPYAKTGKLGALKQIGTFLKALAPSVGGPGMGGEPGGGPVNIGRGLNEMEEGIKDRVNQGMLTDQARQVAQTDLRDAGEDIVQQFAHYFTGGIVSAPKESKDPYVNEAMQSVKAVTGLAAIGGQIALGSGLLGWVSKVPLISSRAANLSAATRGLIQGGILDFGINAAWPEGLPTQDRIGISDDIARAIAPESVLKDPTSLAGRAISGVGGAVEGALLGSLLFGFGHGVKLADAKFGFSITSKQLERMKASLESLGIDASAMSKKDAWLTYRTNMTKHVQSLEEATFNGERMSAESWIAQAFLADPNVTELTPAEGRLLWGVFSNNKGGVSVIRGVTNPEQALEKLKKVGINVEATVIPRRFNAESGAATGSIKHHSIETEIPTVSAEELDRAVELDPSLYSAEIAPSGHVEVQPPGSVAGGLMGKTPAEMEAILHPSKGLPEGVSAPAQRESAGTLAQENVDKAAVDELVGEATATPVATLSQDPAGNWIVDQGPDFHPMPFPSEDAARKWAEGAGVPIAAKPVPPTEGPPVVSTLDQKMEDLKNKVVAADIPPSAVVQQPDGLIGGLWDGMSRDERSALLSEEQKKLSSKRYRFLPADVKEQVLRAWKDKNIK